MTSLRQGEANSRLEIGIGLQHCREFFETLSV